MTPLSLTIISSFGNDSFRISLVPGQGSVQLRVPYATIHYNTVDLESDQDVSIRFLIEYAIDMDDAMKSLEVSPIFCDMFSNYFKRMREKS